MSKFPPKPKSGHLWEGEVAGRPMYEVAPGFFGLGKWNGRPHAEGSYFEHNDVCRWVTDYSLDLKAKEWSPHPVLSFARGVKERCVDCINDPERCICIHRFFEFLENAFKPLPVQGNLFAKEVAQ